MRFPEIATIAGWLLASLLVIPTSAQTPNQNPTPPPVPPAIMEQARRRLPCWQQAGLSQSVAEQVNNIRASTKQQVTAVCADASLSVPQKREKAVNLRKSSREQIDALIPATQRRVLRACETSRPNARRRALSAESPTTDACGNPLPTPDAADPNAPAPTTPPNGSAGKDADPAKPSGAPKKTSDDSADDDAPDAKN